MADLPTCSSGTTSDGQPRDAFDGPKSDSDSEECDDPGDTLTVLLPETETINLVKSPSPRDEVDSGTPFDDDRSYEESTVDPDDLHREWNASLYMLQSQAPVAKCIPVAQMVEDCPPQYGLEYHGHLSRGETSTLLGDQDGSYLVRKNVGGVTVLSLRMNQRVYNYRLYYEDGYHYVGETRFETFADLVQDGLIILYLQQHNVAQTMHEGRMLSIARRRKTEKQLKLLKRSHGKRVKGLKGKKAWEYNRTISDTSLSSVRSPSPTPSPSGSPAPPSPTHDPADSLLPHSPIHSHSPSPSPSPRVVVPEEEEDVLKAKSASDLQAGVEESNLDFKSVSIRRSTPNLPVPNRRALYKPNRIEKRRTSSVSSLQSTNKETSRYTAIISTLRDAVNEDKKRQHLQLDNSSLKIKTSRSDGRIGLAGNQSNDKTLSLDPFPFRAYSCHVPYASSLEKITDCSIKGTNSLSRSSMTALARHTSGPKSPYYKAHNFLTHTYIAPTWCEVCHHFLWGLKHQGMRCKDCGMDVHKQCVPLAIQLECYPNKQCIKRMFGVDLTTLVKLEGGVIPKILDDLFSDIQSRDLMTEGIYRVSGQTSEVVEMKEKFDNGESVDLSQYLDINILTGAVKLYLRELPIPLITFDAYKVLMKATSLVSDPDDPNQDWNSLIDALKLLPKAHYTTLKHLVQHLNKIHMHSGENKMTAQNLSVVFAPTLMRSPDGGSSMIMDLPIQRNFIEYLIIKQDTIFR